MTKPNLKPIFHVMEEMGFRNFVIVGVDDEGVPAQLYKSTSPAGHRVLRAYAEDWCDEQAELSRKDAFGH